MDARLAFIQPKIWVLSVMVVQPALTMQALQSEFGLFEMEVCRERHTMSMRE
tara:strand:- start:279 stop:434 length:156 start_codon:yes stop_codon:yes gene_type:complete